MRRNTSSDESAKAEFRDAVSEPAKDLPGAIFALLFSCMEIIDEVTENEIRQSFVTRDQPIHAQQVLRAAVALRQEGAKPIRWRHVAKDLDVYLSRDTLHEEIQNHFATFIQYQFFLHPQVWPDFLPAVWNALP
jgi:hypothetical protein